MKYRLMKLFWNGRSEAISDPMPLLQCRQLWEKYTREEVGKTYWIDEVSADEVEMIEAGK